MVLMILFIILSVVSMLSIFLLKKRMKWLNITACYMIAIALITLTGVIINVNLQLTKSPGSPIMFWTQKIAELFVKPMLIIWLIAFLLKEIALYKKILLGVLLITALVATEVIFVTAGFLKFVHWNIGYSYLRYLLIVSLTFVYALYIDGLIREEAKTL